MGDQVTTEGLFAVIVRFDTEPEEQHRALAEIGDYVADFLSRQPGFVQSALHRPVEGRGLVHYALWRREADFRAFADKARGHPALPALRRFRPSAETFEVVRAFHGEFEDTAGSAESR